MPFLTFLMYAIYHSILSCYFVNNTPVGEVMMFLNRSAMQKSWKAPAISKSNLTANHKNDRFNTSITAKSEIFQKLQHYWNAI